MKKIYLLIIACVSAALFKYAFASEYEIPCDYFTISAEQQEMIYEMIMQNSGEQFKKELSSMQLSIAKDSIIPVYLIDFFSFVETKKIRIYPLLDELNGSSYDFLESEGKESNVFFADLLTEDGLYGGEILFCIRDNIVYRRWMGPSDIVLSRQGIEVSNSGYETRNSYEKNNKNIQNVLKKEDVDINDVKSIKYTFINELRSKYYCVDCGDRIILIGSAKTDKNGKLMEPFYFYEDDESFIQKVEDTLQDMKEFKEFREQWIKEHPGEPFTYVGGPAPVISNNDNELTTTKSKEKSKWLIILLLIVCISVIMIMGYIIIKKKKILKTIDQT